MKITVKYKMAIGEIIIIEPQQPNNCLQVSCRMLQLHSPIHPLLRERVYSLHVAHEGICHSHIQAIHFRPFMSTKAHF